MADARELRRKLKSSKSSKSDDDELPTPKAPKSSKKLRPSADYQDHYLVGLLNYPNDAIPDILDGVTSGTYINGVGGAPWNYIPR